MVPLRSDLVVVGKVVGIHGFRGCLKVQPLTDYPERFLEMKEMRLYSPEGRLVLHRPVLSVRPGPAGRFFLVELEGVLGEVEARRLVGALVKVSRSERVPLGEGEHWVDDLLGLSVVEEGGGPVGKVVEVVRTRAHDVLVVEDEGGARFMIPFVGAFVRKVDLASGRVEVSLVDGMREP